jgi:protein-tyrosine phosphatase
MAEGLAKKTLGDHFEKIISRGISVYGPEKASSYAVKAMAEKGISIREHKSRGFDPSEVTDQMIILTMTHRHKEFLTYNYPRYRSRVYTLLEYIGGSGDISDPYGLDQSVYNTCADQIEVAVNQLKTL